MKDHLVEFVKWTLILIASGLAVEYIWHTGLGQTLLAHAESLPFGANIGPKINTTNSSNSSKELSNSPEILMI